MLPTFAHLQKDDSQVPLLPYAAGCFLASVLLTISGIAETHPQALALATYLIQLGWLLLHIQGTMLVQQYGNHSQCMTLFKVWLVSVQLMDVHRRYLGSSFTSTSPLSFANSPVAGSTPLRMTEMNDVSSFGSTTMNYFRAHYLRMLCSALPDACTLSTTISASPSWTNSKLRLQNTQEQYMSASSMGDDDLVTGAGAKITATSMVSRSAGVTGMREMEYLVLFEILAGLGVSSVMCLVWLAMALRQGAAGSTSASVRRLSATLHRFCKTLKGQMHEWRADWERRVDALVDGIKIRIA